jgi:hypothetical protein
MFENKVLRRIFELRRDEVTGWWRKLHNEEHHNLYLSPSVLMMIRSGAEMGNACGTSWGVKKDT